jgi:gas vesicle protein
MPDPIKQRITADLERAKAEGKVRSEHLREIFRDAFSQATQELKAGSGEIQGLARDAIAALVESFKDRSENIKDDVSTSVEGIIEGISQSKRVAIAKTESEIQQLQTQIQADEKDLQVTIDAALDEVERAGEDPSSNSEIKAAISSVINALKIVRKRLYYRNAMLNFNLSLLFCALT